MTPLIRNMLIGAGVTVTSATMGYTDWINGKTKDLPADQKGSIFTRTKEVMGAYLLSKQMNRFEGGPYKVKDHLDLVSTLASKQFTVTNNRPKKEIQALRTSYYAGYLAEALRANPGINPPIVRYDENLPVILPTLPGETHKGFVFAGTSPHIHDMQARDSILNGDYRRCKCLLELEDQSEKLSWRKYKHVDVIVTGTTDFRICSHFKKDFLRDCASLAASSHKSIDPEHPYSDTPVFDYSEKGIESRGDLIDMPHQTKQKIHQGDFTVCNNYNQQKTRLSQDSYKKVGAIVTGIKDERVCSPLMYGEIRKFITDQKNSYTKRDSKN